MSLICDRRFYARELIQLGPQIGQRLFCFCDLLEQRLEVSRRNPLKQRFCHVRPPDKWPMRGHSAEPRGAPQQRKRHFALVVAFETVCCVFSNRLAGAFSWFHSYVPAQTPPMLENDAARLPLLSTLARTHSRWSGPRRFGAEAGRIVRGPGLERIENKRRPCAKPAHGLLLKCPVPLNLESIRVFKFSSRFAEVKKSD